MKCPLLIWLESDKNINNLTKNDLTLLLNITIQNINSWFRKKSFPSLKYMQKITKITNISYLEWRKWFNE